MVGKIVDIHSYQEVDTLSSYCLARLGHSCEILQTGPALGFHVHASFLVLLEKTGAIVDHDFRFLVAKAHLNAARVVRGLLVKISQYSPRCFIARRNHQMIES